MNADFWRAAGIRAIRTICQTAVAMIGTSVLLTDVNWAAVASASALAGILSLLTSVATGLPEIEEEPEGFFARIGARPEVTVIVLKKE